VQQRKTRTMKPSIELFKLIKSLTKSEKRFFKLSSSLQSGDKNYLKIFDYIEGHDEYDEEHLKKVFKKETFIKHLPSEKNHLYKLILKSLRSFYAEQSVSSILKQEIKNVEILYTKALYRECEKFVHRAKQIAKEHEMFYYWFELIGWEKKLLEEAYESGEFSADLSELIQEEEEVMSKLRNLTEYQIIYSKINYIFKSGGFSRNETEQEIVNDIAAYHLIKGKNTAISISATSMCYYIKGLCAATNRNYEDSYLFFNRTREILDQNPAIRSENAQRYVLTLSHLLRCYIEKHDFDLAYELIEEMRLLPDKKGFNSTDISVKIFTNTYNLQLTMYQVMGEFNKSTQLIQTIDEKIVQFGDKITKEQILRFYYNKAYAYFGAGEYKRSLHYINLVLNDNEQNLRQDIYNFTRLFNLIVHFELGNYEFLEYVAKSTHRFLNKKDRGYDTETVIVKYFKRLSRTISPIERTIEFEKLKEELDTLLLDHHEQTVLEYFNITAWVNSKIYKVSFQEAIQKGLEAEQGELL